MKNQNPPKTLEEALLQIEMLKKQQDVYEHELQKYHQLFEYTGDSIFILDMATFEIIDVNANATRRLGYSREEFLAMTLDDIEIETESDMSADDLLWHSTFSDTRVYETQYRCKDGTLLEVEVSSRPLRIGNVELMQNHVRDIQRRKAAERQLQEANKKLSVLVDDLRAFSGMVAHDLKNPLGMMTGYATLLQDGIGQLSEERVAYYTKMIQTGTADMQRIIDGLLLIATIGHTEQVQMVKVDILDTVWRARNRLQHMKKYEQAEFIMESPETWPMPYGYAPWVEEVWTNYLSNALKYGGNPAVVRIRAVPIGDTHVRFEVIDNGQGIPKNKHNTVFEQFTRLDHFTQGHGLGLSIVKRIVLKIGGEVGVESVEGQGCTFYFTMPLHAKSD